MTGLKKHLGRGKVRITWKPVAGASSYKVRLSRPGAKKFAAWKAHNKMVFRAKVLRGKRYWFQVLAVGGNGRSKPTTILFRGR